MSSVVVTPHLAVVAHIQLRDSREALLRLLATCHRRVWHVEAIAARAAGGVVTVDIELKLPRDGADTVERQLGKLVDVLSVEARDRG